MCEPVPPFDALAGDAGTDHFGQPVVVARANAETAVDLDSHRLRPGLGADDREAEADLVGTDAPALELLREREGIAGRARDHVGAEVGDQKQLPFGHSPGDGYDGHPEPLGAVVEPEPAGEQPVAVGVVEHHSRLGARHGEIAGVDLGEQFDVCARVAHDRGLPRRAGRPMDARNLLARYREQPEGIVVAEVVLPRERKPEEVVERANCVGSDARLVEALAVEPDPLVDVVHERAQALGLQLAKPPARHRLGGRIVDHELGHHCTSSGGLRRPATR